MTPMPVDQPMIALVKSWCKVARRKTCAYYEAREKTISELFQNCQVMFLHEHGTPVAQPKEDFSMKFENASNDAEYKVSCALNFDQIADRSQLLTNSEVPKLTLNTERALPNLDIKDAAASLLSTEPLRINVQPWNYKLPELLPDRHAASGREADNKLLTNSDAKPTRKSHQESVSESESEMATKSHGGKSEINKETEKDNEKEGEVELVKEKHKEVEQATKDLASACKELVKRGEMLQFLGKWYQPDSAMYQYGMEKYGEALKQTVQDLEDLKVSLQDEQERNRIDTEWKKFVHEQQHAIGALRERTPLLNTASELLEIPAI